MLPRKKERSKEDEKEDEQKMKDLIEFLCVCERLETKISESKYYLEFRYISAINQVGNVLRPETLHDCLLVEICQDNRDAVIERHDWENL